MELNKIRALAELMNEQNLEELQLQENGAEVFLKRPLGKAAAAVSYQETLMQKPQQVKEYTSEQATLEQADDSNAVTITSPMVGVFYASPSPDEAPFVTEGQTVNAGDVLCIIEAMKLMNEIVAEQSGTITQCFAQNGQLVEYGQKLFQMR